MGTEPLAGVIVLFKPDQGRPATGMTDVKGYYEAEYTQGVRGAKVGPTTVMLEWPLGAKNTKPLAAKYTSKSELKVEVKPGTNKFDFNLDTDSSKKIIPAD